MSARRQPSTTSLSKYARASSPDPTARSYDFCNSFWGIADGGVDVLFARMRGGGRTTEELRSFWKERALIEEDYAKRLAKLSKQVVGRDEIGELRNSLETLRAETEKQSSFHLQLAQQIKNELEAPAATFITRQTQHRKQFQAQIEKQFKVKQAQEAHVAKAREKYEQDCLRINSYTAQSTLVQGKDLEKLQMRLERTQQTVQANERDFANFSRALAETVGKWELDWKTFCDSCQDLEEERMEFMKDNVWAYANAISIVCVSDDESCERLRLSLEQFEPEKDQENFVRDYGTGNAIPDPPQFVSYSQVDGAALPSSTNKIITHPAAFPRSSQRPARSAVPPQPPSPSQEELSEPMVNTAGIGALGRNVANDPALNRSQTQSRGSTRGHQPTNSQSNVSGAMMNGGSSSRPGTGHGANEVPPNMVNPTTHKTMLKVGDNAYEVDLSKDPQNAGRGQSRPTTGGSAAGVGDESDPFYRQMASLRSGTGGSGGASVGRSGTRKGTMDSVASSSGAVSPAKQPSAIPPSTSPGATSRHDYRKSAELVVGAYPGGPIGGGSSRPASPTTNPPTASFMRPPPQVAPPAVLQTYEQSLPEERDQRRRSVSNSRPPSWNGGAPQSQQSQDFVQRPVSQNLDRPVSREGRAGIGANGRSRSPSLGPMPNQQAPSARSVSPSPSADYGYGGLGGTGQGLGIQQGQQGGFQRAVSPNSVGIALDPSGKVALDSMADQYMQQQRQQQQQQQQQQSQQRIPPSQTQQQFPPPHSYGLQAPGGAAPGPGAVERRESMQRQTSVNYGQQPSQQAGYGGAVVTHRPQSHGFGSQGQQPSYMQPPPAQSPVYAAPPSHPYATATSPVGQPAFHPQQTQLPPPQQQQPYSNGAGLQRGQSMSISSGGGDYYPNPQRQATHHSYGSSQSSYGGPTGGGGYGGGAVSPGPGMQGQGLHQMQRSPSPQPMVLQQQGQPQKSVMPPPTRQYTEDGRGVLFYVQALYDYTATIPEEFSFQAGDIIAVTATPEDGWWSGELMDEARRIPGKHIFPSNFVKLF